MSNLKVVLFISGSGSDEKQYKPDHDTTQWWSRRDSLARVVASFLFGAPTQGRQTRELVFIFDEDLAIYHMTVDANYKPNDATSSFFPSEKNLITMWREAAIAIKGASNSATVRNGPIRCEIQGGKQPLKTKVSEDTSKRDLLEMIQDQCSIEFLRDHRLNCSLKVALKKANRANLVKVWHLWNESIPKPAVGGSSELESILDELVQSDRSCTKVAATLHESGDELPVWDHNTSGESQNDDLEVLFFLGAVRDMSNNEKACLSKVCHKAGVPFVNVRLGRVAEFTSKVIQVVAFHQSSGVLIPAMHKLLRSQDALSNPKKRRFHEMENSEEALPLVHIMLLIPLKSSELTDDIQHRSREAWCTVRCTVVSLWRSRLAGNVHKAEHLKMGLTLCFLDGLCLRLNRESLVQVMAEQHQAAPSEYQILRSLKQMLQDGKGVDATQEFSNVISTLKKANRDSFVAVQVGNAENAESTIDLGRIFYSECSESINAYSLLAIIQMSAESNLSKLQSTIKKACRSEQIDFLKTSLVRQPCLDLEATTITIMQHFCYQNRLFNALHKAARKEQR